MRTFAAANETARAFSSVGLEHLPYKQRVGGSNPSTPTWGKRRAAMLAFFVFAALSGMSSLLPVCLLCFAVCQEYQKII